MFDIGTYVSYRTEGVCRIVDIRTESFGGNAGRYYILSPLKDQNSVLYVPFDNELLISKMLPLLSEQQIYALARELREERVEWRPESRARGYRFREILGTGDRRELIVLINTITEKAEELQTLGKRLTGGDEALLKRAKKILVDEFSLTSDIKNADALMEVLEGRVPCKNADV